MARDHSLDNAKAVLIILVIFGHLIEPLIAGSAILNSLYLTIYSFHMPAFVVISGLLSKSTPGNDDLIKISFSTLMPFVVFSVFYEAFYWLISGEPSIYARNLLPFWIMWFLVSLFIWRLLLPSFLKLKYPVLVSLLLAIAAGYVDTIGYKMGLSRTIYFFPLFLAGHLIAPKILAAYEMVKLPKTLLFLFGTSVLLLFAHYFDLPTHWIYGSKSYALLGNESYSAGLIRLILLLTAFVLSLVLLALMPRRRTILSRIGQNSLYAYVWHGFFIIAFSLSNLAGVLGTLPLSISLPVLFATSLFLTLCLSSSHVATFTQQRLIAPATRLLTRLFKARPVRSYPKLMR